MLQAIWWGEIADQRLRLQGRRNMGKLWVFEMWWKKIRKIGGRRKKIQQLAIVKSLKTFATSLSFFPSLSLSLTVVDVSILVKCVPSILPQFPRPESIWCCHSYSRWSWPCCTCVALCSSWASVNTWGLIGTCIQKKQPTASVFNENNSTTNFFLHFSVFWPLHKP